MERWFDHLRFDELYLNKLIHWVSESTLEAAVLLACDWVLPLECGVTVIAAHCGTRALPWMGIIFENSYPSWLKGWIDQETMQPAASDP